MGEMLAVVVPEPIQFLHWGWWIIHLIGIAAVFTIGMTIGKKKSGAGK